MGVVVTRILLAVLSTCHPASSAAQVKPARSGNPTQPNGWTNLKNVPRERQYIVQFRDAHCLGGQIVTADEKTLTLNEGPLPHSAISLNDVLRVWEYSGSPEHDVIFSGRSSWRDIQGAAPMSNEHLLFVTNDGRCWQWKHPTILDDSVSFE